jgi:tetratricopeptide (TPR) repeat protein
MFVSALALDPNYARAYSGIAYTHGRDVRFRYTDDIDESIRSAFDYARRAIALDETDSRSHVQLGRAFSLIGDANSAVAECQRGVELNPHDTDALVMTGVFMSNHGRAEEGISLLENGLKLNPLEPRNFNFMALLCFAYLCIGDYQKAVHWGREATRRNPDFFEAHVNLASALGHLDRGSEALDVLSSFDESAISYAVGRPWIGDDETDRLLEGLRKAGVAD